jgi:hypothetical protein
VVRPKIHRDLRNTDQLRKAVVFKTSAVDYDTLVKAGEILHAKLDRLNAGTRKEKRIAKAYAPQFKMLVDLIEKRKPLH